MLKILGIKIRIRDKGGLYSNIQAVVVCNHQHSFDLFIIGSILPKGTVTLGKKGLLMIPFFGMLYWIAGNILIERKKHKSAIKTMKYVGKIVVEKKISILIFPEGTRSWGHGLGKFKKGAFHLAMETGLPLRSVVISSIHKNIDIGRWNAGEVLIDVLPDIQLPKEREDVDDVIASIRGTFIDKINELDQNLLNHSRTA
ncbi:MAG: 1-acylglycerol-3-phosphate O-acyltransferase [Oligoflexia bacterium]|nr:1-acylglycerol-3-phosphate O-acyltransferase [Oligoflexia bacterium]MBF0364816.1 1-acylglycerol-3-phosphate O-acyltransferase [Oligoflexia bacterium]